jgi:hypothetical protein
MISAHSQSPRLARTEMASVRAQRPPLAPGPHSALGQTNENRDAQNAWLAYIEAGRIHVE